MKRKSKIIIPALGMLLLSTAASVTGTVAWFTANNIVTAKNMTVQAEAEKGIVIASYSSGSAPADTDFTDEVNAEIASRTLLPTWTNDAATWYHANSKKSNDGQAYTTAGYATVDNTGTPQYYLVNKFQIKSLGATTNVYVKDINYTAGGSQNYDASIRVLVKTSEASLIFDKAGTRTGSETIRADVAADDALTADKSFTFTQEDKLAAKVLTDVTKTPVDVEIYIYFDGEDASCKSDNIEDAFIGTTFNVSFTSETPAE